MSATKAREAAHRTAISRKGLSAPARYLALAKLLKGRLLDWGCGRGADAELLGADRYDPYWNPELPRGKYDTILCTFVLNVLPPSDEKRVIEEVRARLVPGGRAYFTVRRDLDYGVRGQFTSSGTYQRLVKLPLPLVYERSRAFAIYVLQA